MKPYAVIETGGKQYRVEENQVLNVELLKEEPRSKLALDKVLAVSDGATLQVGTPYLEGTSVEVVVMEHFRAPKVVSFKYKKRKGYRKKQGHRQEQTRLKILSLSGGETAKTEAPAEPEEVEA